MANTSFACQLLKTFSGLRSFPYYVLDLFVCIHVFDFQMAGCAVVVGGAPLAHLDGMPMVGREWQTQPVFSLSCSRGLLRDVSSVTHLIVSALRTRRATFGVPCFARRTWHSVGSWQWSVGVQNDFVALGPTSEFACILSFITSTSFIVSALWIRNANFGHTALHATYLETSRTTSKVTIGSSAG